MEALLPDEACLFCLVSVHVLHFVSCSEGFADMVVLQRVCSRVRRELNAWLDQAEVRRALHAAPEEVTGRFQECTNALNYTHDQPSMLANHRFLLSKGMRAAPCLLLPRSCAGCCHRTQLSHALCQARVCLGMHGRGV